MTERILTKIGSFEQNAPKGVVKVFRFRATPGDEANFGKLFAIGEVEQEDGEKVLRSLEAALGEYYDQGARSRWSAGRSLSTESLFEEILHETNDEWAARPLAPLKNVHIVVGVQKDNALFLASHGRMRALLFRERDGGYLQHFDLLRLREGEEGAEGGLFSHVISGELKAGDSIVVVSSHFLERLTLREVEKALIFTPQSGAALLETQINDSSQNGKDEPKRGLGAFILKRIEDSVELHGRAFASPRGSINEMDRTERKTERVLAPQTFPGLREFLASLTIRSRAPRRQNGFYGARRANPFTKIIRPLLRGFIKIAAALKSIIISLLKFVFGLISNRQNRLKIIGEVRQGAAGGMEKTVANFNLLPKRSKTMLIIGLTLLFVFTQSAMFAARRNYKAEQERAWRSLYDEVSAARDEIESILLYGDEEKARQLLSAAQINLELLMQNNRKHSEEIKNLSNLLEQTALRVRHITVLDSPSKLISLQGEGDVRQLLLFKGKLMAGSAGKTVLIDRETKKIEEIPSPPEFNDNAILAAEDDAVIAVGADKVAILSAGNWEVKPFEKKQRSGLGDAALYGGRLYVLDQESDAVWKYNKTENGFNGESSWLREPYELRGVVSLSIDNALYMLDGRGTIRKFYRGREQEFRAAPLEPAFGAASGANASSENSAAAPPGKIRTTSGSKYLYLLDANGRRLVLYGKDGRLIAQYASPKFDDLRDMAFDESKKEIYLLNGTDIYAIAAAHMEQK
ncbi:hypothetical protein HYT45_02980 [Candidatus Uhrbacteria bacterium]|nr:hypothetical protein [Candidatus Uhrbacteria bacterium]